MNFQGRKCTKYIWDFTDVNLITPIAYLYK